MKLNSLQFGKAMSAALFVLLLVVAGMKNALAQNPMATLQHGDSITGVFYGIDALSYANSAAANGDIITLSSGTFRGGTSFEYKNLSIRGAGCAFDTLANTAPTIINGDIYVGQHDNGLLIEGVCVNGTVQYLGRSSNVKFVKCFINCVKVGSASNTYMNKYQFINCIINEFKAYRIYSTSIINSVVCFTSFYQDSEYQYNNIFNSVVLFGEGVTINNLIVNNSIIAKVSDYTMSNCTFSNCIGIKTGETSLFEGQTASNVMEVNNYGDVFENFVGVILNENCYQLKEEISSSFIGGDGTEVGIYGGMMPYNPHPSYMIMKRCNVASRSTVDGKLSVDIEVITEGE